MPKFYATAAAFNAGTVKETQTFVYDAFGREVSTVWNSFGEPLGVSPRSDVWTNQYDDQSRLIRVTAPTGSVFYEYDVFGRKTRVMSRGPAFTPANTTDYENDIRYSYDIFGRLSSVETYERNNVAVDVDGGTVGNQPETESYAYTLNGSLDYQTNPDGSVTDFTYNDLNRLTDIDEYKKDANTPLVFTDNPKLSEYSYTLRPDGKRDFADEVIRKDDGTVFSHTTFDWNYDAAGRLIDEVFTDVGNLMAGTDDYHATYSHDLTGNRLKKTVDTGNNGSIDESIVYTFDANDRMLTESLDTANNGSVDQTTTYGYTGTQQSAKSVNVGVGGSPLSAFSFGYDLQGRMTDVVSSTYSGGTLNARVRYGYSYGPDWIRIRAREYEAQLNTENWTLKTDTQYLIDANNHTGYQQVLEETVTDGSGNLIKKIVYSIGHDHISQTTFSNGGPSQGTIAVFHMDGHGSARILTDLAGALFTVAGLAQIFHFDAYGNALNFNMSNAATQYLYSGEQFDARIQQQYLRARYYNQANGTFTGLDPYFGNLNDPQSLHKYLYAHADSVNHTDPMGLGVFNGAMRSVLKNLAKKIAEKMAGGVGMRLLSEFGVAYIIARALIGTGATYLIGNRYIDEMSRSTDDVLINRAIARRGDSDLTDAMRDIIESLTVRPDIQDLVSNEYYEIKPFDLGLNQVTPDSTIGGKKAKLLLKTGVIASTRAITTDMQKGVSSEPFQDTKAAKSRAPASVENYTKEACRKQATHR